MGQFGIGQPVRRVEDPMLLRGSGRYTDDIALPGQLYGFVLRSPHAFARIAGLDTTEALASPGVCAIYSHADIAKLGLMPCEAPVDFSDGRAMVHPERPVLAKDFVRHVGDPVAFIVAATLEAARDAAERIAIDYELLPAVADSEAAVAAGAPAVWPEAPDNLCFDWHKGDAPRTQSLIASAAHVVALRLVNNRLVSSAMEPRAAIGSFDGRYTLYTSSQGSHGLRAVFRKMLGVPSKKLRVVTPQVGGGFGTKLFPYPEHALVLFAAEQLRQPVKWTAERSEAFLGDAHGRDNVTRVRAAVDADGRMRAIEVDTLANLGAYLSDYAPFVATEAGCGMLCGVYRFEAAHVRVRGTFTNTAPVDAYRGAGRPEAAYVVERLIEAVAVKLGKSAAEIRRVNFIQPEQMPFTTALGMTYDSGDFARNMEDALAEIGSESFAARRAASARGGRLRGLGIATYIEACAGGGPESASVAVEPDGKVTLLIGTQDNGQGHATAYAQIIAERLGIDVALVTMHQGDTDIVVRGSGTGGSRSVPVGGAACDKATRKLIEKGRRLAGHYLESAVADIEYGDGWFTIVGTDRRIALAEVAARAAAGELPEGEEKGLAATERFKPAASTFPNGCHAVEIEIDPETGATEILRFTIVDDFGTVVNPLLLAGQVYGGATQGIGQALSEQCIYDPDSGQLLTGSFMDYGMPHALGTPSFAFRTNAVPCRTHPMGIKGAGEAGAIGAPPAVINALLDALRPVGVTHIDMPATPQKIWQAIRAAQGKAAA